MTWVNLPAPGQPTWVLNTEGPLVVMLQEEVVPLLLQEGGGLVAMIQEERWSNLPAAVNPGWA